MTGANDVEVWERLAGRLNAEARALRVHCVTNHDLKELAQRLRHTPELADAAAAAQSLDERYRLRSASTDTFADMGRVDAAAAITALISRSGLAAAALACGGFSGEALRNAFLDASRQKEAAVTCLIVLDGLELDVDVGASSDSEPSLRQLNDRYLGQFFEGEVPGDIPRDHLLGLAAIEFTERSTNPPWTPTVIDLGSMNQRVRQKAWPWTAYVNLFSTDGLVQPVAVYRKAQSLLCTPLVRATVASQPTWEPRFVQVSEDDWEEFEVPFVSMSANAGELLSFMREMEAARLEAIGKGHRADTALRLFSRYVESTRRWSDLHVTDDEEVLDRSIVDGFTLLEALSLERRERDKGKKMASRLAALLSDSEGTEAALLTEIKDAYGTRSDIVHADVRPDSSVLTSVAALLLRLTRPALVGFLRAGGDVRDVVRCETDRDHARRMHALTRLPR